MKRNPVPVLVAAAVLVSALSLFVACEKKKINPNDATSPTVVLKVKKNGQYEPATTTDLKEKTLDLACTVSDPDGVRSLELSFLGSSSNNCTINSQLHPGSFPVPLPPPQEQNLQGDASGDVLDSTTAFTTVTRPTCTDNGEQGSPIGHVITAQCVGKNWSSNPSNSTKLAELKLTVN